MPKLPLGSPRAECQIGTLIPEPGGGSQAGRNRTLPKSRTRYSLRTEVSQAVAPLHHTLKVLGITGPGHTSWPPPELSRIVLSGFGTLKRAAMLSNSFFPIQAMDDMGDGLYEVLPHSLLELQIDATPRRESVCYIARYQHHLKKAR
ncbi:hypothetical protein V8E51_010912 [Hyaloscypha variabilis]